MAQPNTVSKRPASSTVTRQYLNEYEVAELTGIAVATLRRWRFDGRGPKWTKLGGCVKYKLSDVKEWLAACPTGGGIAASA